MLGKTKDSLKMRLAYGVSAGPVMVAVHSRRLFGSSGKAETPGVEDIISCMSSVWRLCANVREVLQSEVV